MGYRPGLVEAIRIGVIGLRRGRRFLQILSGMEDVKITALCDIDQNRLDEVGDKYGVCDRYLKYENMLDSGIDAVILATPFFMHAQQAIQALRMNIHVLSEVTAVASLEDAILLVREVRRSRGKYMMAENYCFLKTNEIVRKMVREGVFGEIYYGEGEYLHEIRNLFYDSKGRPTWRFFWGAGRWGDLYCTHSLGPLLEWFDERVVKVVCLGSGSHTAPDLLKDDTVVTLCKTESGALLRIRHDVISNRPHLGRYYSLQGTKGCYEAPRGLRDTHKIWIMDYCEKNEWKPLDELGEKYLPEHWRKFGKDAERYGHGGGDYFVIREFIDSILQDRTPRIDVYKALDFTLPGLLSRYSMYEGGKPVSIPNPRDF
ncbi:MAG TPA: Gfo/Idh/MocA family oxidoreductase [Candidatus Bathyarchaeota archaeon]|nr:Gfo/Idh/MocA family oxidoreductase [Candidatus Bathyarchaeota archaeon]